MSVDVIKDMGHSVNARLKSLAGQRGVGFDYLLLRYACERFLFRLGRSEHSSRFILKGACAFSVWFGPMFRVTRDTDFLCHGNPAPEHLVQCFRDICATEVTVSFSFFSNRFWPLPPFSVDAPAFSPVF